MAQPHEPHDKAGSYEEMLLEQAQQLRELKVRASNPSMRAIARRAKELFEDEKASLPPTTQHNLFRGDYASLDKLMWLVRTLMSWDRFGQPRNPPAYGAPELDEWHERWTAITAAKPPRRPVRTALAPVSPDSQTTESDTTPAPSIPEAVEFLPNGTPVTGSHDQTVQLYERATTSPSKSPVAPLAMHAVSHAVEHGRQVALPPFTKHQAAVRAVAFSPDPDRTLLATGSNDRTALRWNPATLETFGEPLTGLRGVVYAMAYSRLGILAVASHCGTVRLWTQGTRKPAGKTLTGHQGPVYALAFSPNGDLLATGSQDHTIRLWNPDTRKPVGEPLTGHQAPVLAVAFCPDGTLLATGSSDGTIRLWNPDTHEPVGGPLIGHQSRVLAMAFSPDGLLLVTDSQAHTVRLWAPDTHEPVGEPLIGHQGPVRGLAFSPNGLLLATGSSDGTIRLWDPMTRKPVGEPLTGHQGVVHAVAFSPDGTLLASGGDDHTVRLWTCPVAAWSVRSSGI